MGGVQLDENRVKAGIERIICHLEGKMVDEEFHTC